MNPDELARYRFMADQCRKARRMIEAQNAKIAALQKENAALKEGLLAADSAFDKDNADLFEAVHRNHKTRVPYAVTYYYGA